MLEDIEMKTSGLVGGKGETQGQKFHRSHKLDRKLNRLSKCLRFVPKTQLQIDKLTKVLLTFKQRTVDKSLIDIIDTKIKSMGE